VGNYLTLHEWTGVWLSSEPLDEQSGGYSGDAVVVEIPAELVEPYEWIEEGKAFREFLVPAALANEFPRRLIRDWWNTP
jgi:hypothetical protein